jgi:hypothetical protein
MAAYSNYVGEIPTKTIEDARTRVYMARLGSLAGATVEYTQELQLQLRLWMRQVDESLAQGIQRAIEQEENQTESYRTAMTWPHQ